MFNSNVPKTKSSSIYINTSSGTTHMPFIRTSLPRNKSSTQSRTRNFSAHKTLPNKFPKSGILRKRWKAIYFSNFAVKDTKKKRKSKSNYSNSNRWNLIDLQRKQMSLISSSPTRSQHQLLQIANIFKTRRSHLSWNLFLESSLGHHSSLCFTHIILTPTTITRYIRAENAAHS